MRRARVLLSADVSSAGCQRTDREIAAAAGVDARTVRRVRATFAQRGFADALQGVLRKRKSSTKLSAAQEEWLLVLAETPPPPGYPRWTVRTLAAELCTIEGMPVVSRELVRRTLKRLQGRTENLTMQMTARGLLIVCLGAQLPVLL